MIPYNVIERITENVWTNIYKRLLPYKIANGDRKLIANEVGYQLEKELNNIDETEREIIREQEEGIREREEERQKEARTSAGIRDRET